MGPGRVWALEREKRRFIAVVVEPKGPTLLLEWVRAEGEDFLISRRVVASPMDPELALTGYLIPQSAVRDPIALLRAQASAARNKAWGSWKKLDECQARVRALEAEIARLRARKGARGRKHNG